MRLFSFTLHHRRTDGHTNLQCPMISALHIENLYLRISEIVLASQLKTEGKVTAHRAS